MDYNWTMSDGLSDGSEWTLTSSSPPDVQHVEFEGIASGDMECFCWDVDRATFERLTGEAPEDRSHLHDGLFRLYPNEWAPLETERKKRRWRITSEPVEE